MRVERALAEKGPSGGLLGAVMGMTLAAGVLLSLAAPVIPTELDTYSLEVGRSEAAQSVSATPESILLGEASMEGASLDLQLD